LSTNTAKRPEFLQNLIPTPKHEPEVEEAERALKEMRGAVPTPMLDFAFRDGRMRSFSYALLKEVDFVPGDTITLKFIGGEEVIIEGRGLWRHRQSLRLHRADEIRECTEAELMQDGQGVSQVERILITEGDRAFLGPSVPAEAS
jgi:hypothetical protein